MIIMLLFFKSETHKTFERTLIYYDTDTQLANFGGNPLRQAIKRLKTTVKRLKTTDFCLFVSCFRTLEVILV